MAKRTRKMKLNDDWKARISASNIVNRLGKHVEGQIEMSSTQIKAADILLRKVIPDLARTEMTGKDGEKLSLLDLIGIANKPK